MRWLVKVGLAFVAMAGISSAHAQTKWPERAVKLVVPFAPGGPNDTVARLWVDRLGQSLGQPIVIDNRGGASGMIGSEVVARAVPDGYTLLIASSSTLAIVPVVTKTSFDPIKDFTPIARVGDQVQGYAMHPSVPANTLQEMLAYARKNPGKLAVGTAGAGTLQHLVAANINLLAGVDILHVPYRGSADAMNDLLAGNIQLMSDIIVYPQVKAGKLKLLAIASDARHPDFPDTPTMAEAGLPGAALPNFYSLFGPAGMDSAIATKINAAVAEIAQQPEMIKQSRERGVVLKLTNPADTGKALADALATNRVLVQKAGIKIE